MSAVTVKIQHVDQTTMGKDRWLISRSDWGEAWLDCSTLGDALRLVREYYAMTQERMARAIDVPDRTYRRWERNETTPHKVYLERIERKLAELFGE